MTTLDDVRKAIEATLGNLTPDRAQELARSWADPDAAREQVSKLAADILAFTQRSRDRLRELIGREVAAQLKAIGVATQSDLDAVRRRVRELERGAGMTASGRKAAAPKVTVRKPAAPRKATSRKPAARAPAGSRSTTSARA